MEIRYIHEDDFTRNTLKLFRDRTYNRIDFERDEAERIARRLHDSGCYVRIDLGGSMFCEYGSNPLK